MILKDQMRVIKLITIDDIPGTTLILRVARVKYAVIHIHPLCLTSLFFMYLKFLLNPNIQVTMLGLASASALVPWPTPDFTFPTVSDS